MSSSLHSANRRKSQTLQSSTAAIRSRCSALLRWSRRAGALARHSRATGNSCCQGYTRSSAGYYRHFPSSRHPRSVDPEVCFFFIRTNDLEINVKDKRQRRNRGKCSRLNRRLWPVVQRNISQERMPFDFIVTDDTPPDMLDSFAEHNTKELVSYNNRILPLPKWAPSSPRFQREPRRRVPKHSWAQVSGMAHPALAASTPTSLFTRHG